MLSCFVLFCCYLCYFVRVCCLRRCAVYYVVLLCFMMFGCMLLCRTSLLIVVACITMRCFFVGCVIVCYGVVCYFVLFCVVMFLPRCAVLHTFALRYVVLCS